MVRGMVRVKMKETVVVMAGSQAAPLAAGYIEKCASRRESVL